MFAVIFMFVVVAVNNLKIILFALVYIGLSIVFL